MIIFGKFYKLIAFRFDMNKTINKNQIKRTNSQERSEINGLEKSAVSEEEIFSYDQVIDFISYASSLQSFDEKRKELISGDGSKEGFMGLLKKQKFSRSEVYKITKDSFPEEYIRKAIEIKDMSPERQLEDIKKYHVHLSNEFIKNAYIESILASLRSFEPASKFEYNPDRYNRFEGFFSKISSEKREGKILFWRRKVYETTKKLATFYSGRGEGNFYISDPMFTHACGNVIRKLDKQFNIRTEITREYYTKTDFIDE